MPQPAGAAAAARVYAARAVDGMPSAASAETAPAPTVCSPGFAPGTRRTADAAELDEVWATGWNRGAVSWNDEEVGVDGTGPAPGAARVDCAPVTRTAAVVAAVAA